jgi:hypothetical protein
MNSRARVRTSVSIGSNQLSKRSTAISAAGCEESGFVVVLVMAWSPVQRFNAGWFEVDHPGDYATLNSYQPRYATVSFGEPPRLFGVEPPRPRIEAIRIVDMGASNSWAEFAVLFRSTRPAFLEHERAKTELKGLMPEDAKEAFGHGIRAKRSKSGGVSFAWWMGRPIMHRSSESIAAGGGAGQGPLTNPENRLPLPSGAIGTTSRLQRSNMPRCPADLT